MRRLGAVVGLLLAAQMTATAQDLDPGGTIKKLAARASKTIDVNLDQSMLRFASAFLDPKDPDQAQAKKIIANMKGIYVHSLEFDKSGEYTEGDLSALRDALKQPEWSRIVNVRSKRDGENVEIYFKKDGEKFEGLILLATEPTEFTFVDIAGPITPEDVMRLGGHFGIPKVNIDQDSPTGKGQDK